MSGLTFNGKHSRNDIGLIMRSRNRAILPEPKDDYIDLPGRDGSLLFPGALPDRFQNVEFAIPSRSLLERQAKAHQIAAWLRTRDRALLIFDDEPGLFYMAKQSNQIDLDQVAMAGRFLVIFRCSPYALADIGAFDGNYEYDTGLDYDGDLYYPNEISSVWNIKVMVMGQYNYGHVETSPAITVTGICSNPTFINETTGKQIQYAGNLGSSDTLVINLDKMTATKNGVNVLASIVGEFWTMAVGENRLKFSSASIPNAVIGIDYDHKFL